MLRVFGLILILLLGTPGFTYAQAVADPAAARAATQAALAKADGELRDLTRDSAKTDDDAALSALRDRALAVQNRAEALDAQLTARLGSVADSLAQLGPATPGAESAAAAEARARLARGKTAIETFDRQARSTATAARLSAERIAERRQALFNARLYTRSPSPFSAALWADIGDNLPRDVQRLSRLVRTALEPPSRRGALPRGLGLLALAALSAALLIGPARVALERLGRRWAERDAPSGDLAKSGHALWRLAAGTALPALAAGALNLGLGTSGLLSPPAAEVASAAVTLLAWLAFVTALGRAFLSVDLPAWRLPPLSDSLAKRLRPYPWLVGGATAGGALVERVNGAIGASLAATVAANCAISLAYAAVAGLGLLIIGRARIRELNTEEGSELAGSPLRSLVTLAVLLAVALAIVAALLGYFAFAYLVARQILWIGITACLLYLLLRFVDDAFTAAFSGRGRVSGGLAAALGVRAATVEQLGVVGSALTRVLLLFVALGVVLAPFGAGGHAVLGRFGSVATGFKIGGLTLSPLGLATGLLSFFVGLWIVRAVQRWLNQRYLPKTEWDAGVRASVSTAVGYLGVVVAFAYAAASMGLALQQIALIASALSVGIGFGLQQIVSNFISGLILLIERPVKVGDWVAVGDQEGDVRRINVRATELALFDRSTLIVPNSEFVTKTVRNVTHGDNLGRVALRLTLAQDSDVEAARAAFFAAAKANTTVLREPEPLVLIDAVTDAGVVMVGYMYLASPRLVPATRSALYFDVLARLRTAGVALAKGGATVQVEFPPSAARRGSGEKAPRPATG